MWPRFPALSGPPYGLMASCGGEAVAVQSRLPSPSSGWPGAIDHGRGQERRSAGRLHPVPSRNRQSGVGPRPQHLHLGTPRRRLFHPRSDHIVEMRGGLVQVIPDVDQVLAELFAEEGQALFLKSWTRLGSAANHSALAVRIPSRRGPPLPSR